MRNLLRTQGPLQSGWPATLSMPPRTHLPLRTTYRCSTAGCKVETQYRKGGKQTTIQCVEGGVSRRFGVFLPHDLWGIPSFSSFCVLFVFFLFSFVCLFFSFFSSFLFDSFYFFFSFLILKCLTSSPPVAQGY